MAENAVKRGIYRAINLSLLLVLVSVPAYAGILFEDKFDDSQNWNASGEYNGKECSPLGVGAPNACTSSTYPAKWSAYRSVPGASGLSPVVSIANPPYGGDHTTGSGKAAIIRQESVSGKVWPGDGILLKYLGGEYKELYIQFWFKTQSGWQFDPSKDGYMKMFRVSRKGKFASNWFDEFTQGVRPVPQMIIQPKHNPTYGWRHIDPLRGYPDDNGTQWKGVCADKTVWNGRTVCNYGLDKIEDPYVYTNPTIAWDAPGQLFDGSWHRVVYRLKMNDVGVANGILQMWIDGVQKTNATQLKWIGNSGTAVGFNQFAIGGNSDNTFNSSKPSEQWYAIDDVVVSTTAIPADYVPGGASTTEDTTSPTAAITAPAGGNSVTGTVSVTATASDNVGVSKVDFYVNGALKSTDTSTPYLYSWDTASLASGTYTLMAKAYDAAGNVGQSANVSVNVVKDATAPSVSVTAPANGATVSGTVAMTATATDNIGVSKVEFYRSGVLMSASNVAPYSYSWNTTSVANGSYALTAKAYDAAGNVGQSSTVTVSVNNGSTSTGDTTAPTVSLTAPLNGATVSGTAAINATAADNVAVSRVEFYVNGVLKGTDTAAPYSYSWNTTTVANGSYTLMTKAFDAAGNVQQSGSVVVTVKNSTLDTTAPTVSITSPANYATVKGTVTIAASASDNVGVTKVEFYINGTRYSTDTTAPYSYSIGTTRAQNGSYTLTVKAYDAAGNVKQSAPVYVKVSN